MSLKKIGSWAFIGGMILAILMGLIDLGTASIWILAVLGVIVGFLNVTHTEARLYLVASIAFMLSAQSLAVVWPAIKAVLTNVQLFVATGAAIVSFRAIYDIAREQ